MNFSLRIQEEPDEQQNKTCCDQNDSDAELDIEFDGWCYLFHAAKLQHQPSLQKDKNDHIFAARMPAINAVDQITALCEAASVWR